MRLRRRQRPTKPPEAVDVTTVHEVAALVSAVLERTDVEQQVWAAARRYALAAEPLQVLLDDVDASLAAVGAAPADATLLRRVAVAWSEVFLTQFGRVTCVDPLTGLETRQHLLRHLQSQNRDGGGEGWSLLVIDLRAASPDVAVSSVEALSVSMALVDAAEVVRPLVVGDHVVSLSPYRCAGLLRRSTAQDRALEVASRLRHSVGLVPRVWVLDVPAEASALPAFLAEAAHLEAARVQG